MNKRDKQKVLKRVLAACDDGTFVKGGKHTRTIRRITKKLLAAEAAKPASRSKK